MRKSLLISIFSFALLTACDPVRDELHSTDGFAGPQMDKLLFASTPEQRADRYLLSLAILAPVILESSEAGLETKASIDRVRNAYAELAELYLAAQQCQFDTTPFVCHNSELPGVFQFENMSYDVQKSLFQIAKAIIVNLDLDESAESLLSLNMSSLSALSKNGSMYFRTFRRGAASYRDAIVIYSNGVARSCLHEDCESLKSLLRSRYSGSEVASPRNSPASQERYLKRVMGKARDMSETRASGWKLTPELRIALLGIIDDACHAAYPFQVDGLLETDKPSNCGPGNANASQSEERTRLVSAFQPRQASSSASQ